MTAIERCAEIMRILVARRSANIRALAAELGVCRRTICTDIEILTVDYPLETVRGNGGCVRVAEWYHPHRNIMSMEQEEVLAQLMESATEQQREVLAQMLDCDLKQILSFGDMENDMPMLECSSGVIMDNARDELKARIPLHTAAVDKEGIYDFLSKNGLI